jgi:hypothetical protein
VGKHEFSSIKIKVKSDKQNPLMLKKKSTRRYIFALGATCEVFLLEVLYASN